MMNNFEMKPYEQCSGSLWFEEMAHHGNGDDNSNEIEDGCAKEMSKKKRPHKCMHANAHRHGRQTRIHTETLAARTGSKRTHGTYTRTTHAWVLTNMHLCNPEMERLVCRNNMTRVTAEWRCSFRKRKININDKLFSNYPGIRHPSLSFDQRTNAFFGQANGHAS